MKPPPYQSVLERFPDHAKAIGMTSIEIANLDIFFGYLFGAILRIGQDAGAAIYLTPKSNLARLELIESAINALLADKSQGKKHLLTLFTRARTIVQKRLVAISSG
jgi:hypothetical protein